MGKQVSQKALHYIREYLEWQQGIIEREDIYNHLTDKYRQKLIDSTISLESMKQIGLLWQFIEGVVFLKGAGGTGKTLTMTQLGYNLKEFFGKHVLADYRLTDDFGPYTFMDTDEFVAALNDMDETQGLVKGKDDRKKEEMAELAKAMMNRRGIVFDNAVLLWDEANRKLSKYRRNSRMVMTHLYYVQTWRHYHSTLICSAPDLDEIAPAALQQTTVELACSFDPERGECIATGIHRHTLQPIVLRPNMHRHKSKYNTYAPVSVASAIRSFSKLKV